MINEGWVVLRTRPRHELLAAGAVDARGLESFVPLVTPQRKSEPVVPLFPGYIFARIADLANDVLRIRSAPGIAYVLPHGGQPSIVPDLVIDVIRRRLADSEYGPATQYLQPGDRVQLMSGPFRWVEAVFDRRLSAAGRVRVLLEIAHHTIQLNIEETQLRRA